MTTTTNTAKAMPDGAVMLKRAEGMYVMATGFIINSDLMYEAAGEQLKSIKAKAKALTDERMGITRPMDAAKKKVMDLFKKPLERLEQAESCIKEAMLSYDQEKQARAAAAQKLLDEHAAKERERTENIAREQADLATKESQRADALEAAGNTQEAAAARAASQTASLMATTLQSSAAVTTALTVKADAPKVDGIKSTQTWRATVNDKRALLAYIVEQSAENPAFLDWVDINMAPLNEMARALKKAMRVPGVDTHEEVGIAASSR